MSMTFDDIRELAGFLSLTGYFAFIVLGTVSIFIQRAFFSRKFDLGRLYVGLFFILFPLDMFFFLLLDHLDGGIAPDQMEPLIGSVGILLIFVAIGIRALWLFRAPLRKATCRELRGACDVEIHGRTVDEMRENSRTHVLAMLNAGDAAHIAARDSMKQQDFAESRIWYRDFQRRFNSLPKVEKT